jgi:hypothetical protein
LQYSYLVYTKYSSGCAREASIGSPWYQNAPENRCDLFFCRPRLDVDPETAALDLTDGGDNLAGQARIVSSICRPVQPRFIRDDAASRTRSRSRIRR